MYVSVRECRWANGCTSQLQADAKTRVHLGVSMSILPAVSLVRAMPVGRYLVPFRLTCTCTCVCLVLPQDVAKQLRDQQMVMKGHRDDALVHVSLVLLY